MIDLANRSDGSWQTRDIVTGFENEWSPIASTGDTVYFMPNKDAPRYRIVIGERTRLRLGEPALPAVGQRQRTQLDPE